MEGPNGHAVCIPLPFQLTVRHQSGQHFADLRDDLRPGPIPKLARTA